jgi:hypothetical protein
MVVGVFAALGIAFLLEPEWLLPLTVLFLLPAIYVLARDARRRGSWLPCWLGVGAALAMLCGKFLWESDPVMYGGMAALIAASIWSAAPAPWRKGENRMAKRVFEVFSAGCPLCGEAIEEIRSQACESCEVLVRDMNDPEVAERARALGIRSVPAVAVDGHLADCCSSRGIDVDKLKEMGLGRP